MLALAFTSLPKDRRDFIAAMMAESYPVRSRFERASWQIHGDVRYSANAPSFLADARPHTHAHAGLRTPFNETSGKPTDQAPLCGSVQSYAGHLPNRVIWQRVAPMVILE